MKKMLPSTNNKLNKLNNNNGTDRSSFGETIVRDADEKPTSQSTGWSTEVKIDGVSLNFLLFAETQACRRRLN